MENSEDDAGSATNASRVEMARERDIGQMEDSNATTSVQQQEPSEPKTYPSSIEPSDDYFDGETGLSPSSHDVNTSTEAILSMIDEFVDGPLASHLVQPEETLPITSSTPSVDEGVHSDSETVKSACSGSLQTAPLVTIEESLNKRESTNNTTESLSTAENSARTINVCSEQNTSESEQHKNDIGPLHVAEASTLVAAQEVPIISTPKIFTHSQDSCGSNLPPAHIPGTSKCENQQTPKCKVSSESKDSVTLGSVQSTSSDHVSGTVTQSPLRRKLIRPPRPDTTVSSTVDYHSEAEPYVKTSVAKDVSSSSDAIVSTPESRTDSCKQVSEISVCKAENTVSTPRKIKLIRNRIAPVNHVGSKTETEPQQCQSTSSDISCDLPKVNSENSSEYSASISGISHNASPATTASEHPNTTEDNVEINSNHDIKISNNSDTTGDSSSQESIPISTQDSACVSIESSQDSDTRNMPPLKINVNAGFSETSSENMISEPYVNSSDSSQDHSTVGKQVPKLTIKLGPKHGNESDVAVPKLTIKPLRLPTEEELKDNVAESSRSVPNITKLNIKPIVKPPEKLNDAKSSSSEISESESSENDESTSASDQASTSDQPQSEIVPKVTIKLGKPGTQIEGQFYTQQNIPKLTIKGLSNDDKQDDDGSKLKIKISQSEDHEKHEKIPKLTIKPVMKPVSQPSSPKLIIKPIKPPDNASKDGYVDHCENQPIPKLKITQESLSPRETVPKITIKPVLKTDSDINVKFGKKVTNKQNDESDNIPVVTKLNIKPIPKPVEVNNEFPDCIDDKVPVVSKLNIKPIVKPKNNEVDSIEDIPKVKKINIKPLRNPEEQTSDTKDCDGWIADDEERNIPIVNKINIKPIVKPLEEETSKDSEIQSSETGNSSDENSDQIPIIKKLNIKPIVKPDCDSNPVEDEPKHPPLLMKINIKQTKSENIDGKVNNSDDNLLANNKNDNAMLLTKLSTRTDSEELSHRDRIKGTDLLSKTEDGSAVISERAVEQGALNDVSFDPAQSSIYNELDNRSGSKELARPILESKNITPKSDKEKPSVNSQNCTLLKKLLEEKPIQLEISDCSSTPIANSTVNSISPKESRNFNCDIPHSSPTTNVTSQLESKLEINSIAVSDSNVSDSKMLSTTELHTPLEINTTEKVVSSGQDSPRIILKINKTDSGASAKIITEDVHCEVNKPKPENTPIVNDRHIQKRSNYLGKDNKKTSSENTPTLRTRLRSRAVQEADPPPAKRAASKSKSLVTDSTENRDNDMSALESKRMKLGQILNKSISQSMTSVVNKLTDMDNEKSISQSMPSENPKNGNSKLHKILSNLQTKKHDQTNCMEMNKDIISNTDIRNNSTESSADIATIENSHLSVQQMMLNEGSSSRDYVIPQEESKDPLEMDPLKVNVSPMPINMLSSQPEPEMITPTPKKRGRPRKQPLTESPKSLPVPALEERPSRSLRLSRDRPAILSKPRGRGRGRGSKRHIADTSISSPELSSTPSAADRFFSSEQVVDGIDPTSSSIKLPRMTELSKMPSMSLSNRRRDSAASDRDTDGLLSPLDMGRPRTGPGSRGGRGRTPKGRGRGRGGGKGAVYMKETMGIYGRVCGPATTTVQLFEEETCMMDDNATPAKPSHLLDEDSQSSVKSSTNDSTRTKKFKFAELFDSKKVWTAADVKEYSWPLQDSLEAETRVMMIQEQVAMFLGVKGFKRRYPELKRRTVIGAERSYVLSKGLVSEALCDLGITAVDASEVLDIMLSDYPHKYEEYRAHQRERQRAEPSSPDRDSEPMERVDRVEMKMDAKMEPRPEPPKIDPEKLRQEMAAAAVAAAAEFNARLNQARRSACVDLQNMQVLRRRRPADVAPAPTVAPPVGFYPLALLPGQYQHSYNVYTSEQLRYFPLNTALSAPPATDSPVESESESEREWETDTTSTDDSDTERSCSGPKRRKLSKIKRLSAPSLKEDSVASPSSRELSTEGSVEVCRVCGLREEANRKFSHERFLSCANCQCKLHPSCVELSADTIRKCREYAWMCAECKVCADCSLPADDDKMLFCDLCDRGFHIYCVGLRDVPNGRWHCVECAVCKSCGSRSPSGDGGGAGAGDEPPEWHHQTRRGPGGHKLYSHSLCTPCASKTKMGHRQNVNTKSFQIEEKSRDADKKAYRIGRYCPLCERSFIGPKGTMQLVICKLCDRQLHQECVKQTVVSLNVLDYTCAECRRGGITSRAAAARAAPRTIATLFMAKRRFNKYAHRQYLASRLKDEAGACDEPGPSDEPPGYEPNPCDDSGPCDEPGLSDEAGPSDDPALAQPDIDPLQSETENAVKALQMEF